MNFIADTRQSPAQVGLPDYLASVKRVERGISDMAATNMRAQQGTVGDYNELRNEGILKLEDVFRALASERVPQIEPLHFITKGIYEGVFSLFKSHAR